MTGALRNSGWWVDVPRPRRFLENVSPEQVCREYSEGRSTRELEARYGVSRWVITAWVQSPNGWSPTTDRNNGVPLRSKDEALGKQRYFASLEEERAEAERCVWPRCTLPADDLRLCAGHWLEVAEHEGRTCAWPPVCWERAVGQHLCDFHLRKCRGEISG